jgi:hypothetical protein
LITLFGAAQLYRPARTNPSIDAARTIQAKFGTTSPLVAVLDRSCGDCHSNATDWSRYTRIAPVSWVITHGVKAGRAVLNFSEWDAYPAARQQELLAASCTDAANGKMPGSAFTAIRPEAKLSKGDIEIICAAARATETNAATASIKP